MRGDPRPDQRNAVERGGFDPHSVFSRILSGELPATIVHRDELVAAFLDIQPITPGHTLVVPLVKAATLAELPAATYRKNKRPFHPRPTALDRS
ncbi:MAG: hypothetical protein CMN57_09490 [Gammaproteobacteria bacterium]|nr:hypothetical protein [Gammaproteobacteria bacterium]